MKKARKDLSTGQVAEIIAISQQTVIRSFDNGQFSGGYRLPGSGKFRRIPLEGLLAFAEINKIPVNEAVLERIKKKNNLNSDVPVDSSGIESTVSKPVATKTAEAKPIRVLVIDNNGSRVYFERIRGSFQKNNCVVRVVNNIFWAGKTLAESQYDIVLVSESFQQNLVNILRSFPMEKLGNILGILVFGILVCDVENFTQCLQSQAVQRRQKSESHPPLIVFYY